MSLLLNKLDTVDGSCTVHRYDNGWMLEVPGRNQEGDWATAKILCNTEEELIEYIRQYNTVALD